MAAIEVVMVSRLYSALVFTHIAALLHCEINCNIAKWQSRGSFNVELAMPSFSMFMNIAL